MNTSTITVPERYGKGDFMVVDKGKSIKGMEYLRGTVTLSAANTFTQAEIPTPVGRANNMAMLIHEIQYEVDPLEGIDTPADQDMLDAQLTKSSQTGLLGSNNEDVIDHWEERFLVLTSGAWPLSFPVKHTFSPPIILAKSKIFLGAKTNGQGDADQFNVKIGYTIETLKQADFLEALVD